MRTIGILLILLFGLILQSTFFQFINIGGHYPDLVLMTLLVIGVFYEKEESWKYGLIIGVLKDVLFGGVFGMFGLTYLTTVLTVSYLGASVFKENVIAPLLMFPVGVVLSNGMLFLLRYFTGLPTALDLYLETWTIGYWMMNLAGLVLIYVIFKQLRQRGHLLDSTKM